LLLFFLLKAIGVASAQEHPASLPIATVHGIIKSGNMPIPGAAVSLSSASSPQKFSTWTDVDGSYSIPVPTGVYTVSVQMVAFANRSQQVTVDASHTNVVADFELSLL